MARTEMIVDDSSEPTITFRVGTPIRKNGTEMRPARATVQPRSLTPDPVFPSRTPAIVR